MLETSEHFLASSYLWFSLMLLFQTCINVIIPKVTWHAVSLMQWASLCYCFYFEKSLHEIIKCAIYCQGHDQ